MSSDAVWAEAQMRALGFHRAADLFPDDVHAAARRAVALRVQLGAPADPACEPWPLMRCSHLDERRGMTAAL